MFHSPSVVLLTKNIPRNFTLLSSIYKWVHNTGENWILAWLWYLNSNHFTCVSLRDLKNVLFQSEKLGQVNKSISIEIFHLSFKEKMYESYLNQRDLFIKIFYFLIEKKNAWIINLPLWLQELWNEELRKKMVLLKVSCPLSIFPESEPRATCSHQFLSIQNSNLFCLKHLLTT